MVPYGVYLGQRYSPGSMRGVCDQACVGGFSFLQEWAKPRRMHFCQMTQTHACMHLLRLSAQPLAAHLLDAGSLTESWFMGGSRKAGRSQAFAAGAGSIAHVEPLPSGGAVGWMSGPEPALAPLQESSERRLHARLCACKMGVGWDGEGCRMRVNTHSRIRDKTTTVMLTAHRAMKQYAGVLGIPILMQAPLQGHMDT